MYSTCKLVWIDVGMHPGASAFSAVNRYFCRVSVFAVCGADEGGCVVNRSWYWGNTDVADAPGCIPTFFAY